MRLWVRDASIAAFFVFACLILSGCTRYIPSTEAEASDETTRGAIADTTHNQDIDNWDTNDSTDCNITIDANGWDDPINVTF